MRLSSELREHYRRAKNGWVPKRSFESKEQIEKELGYRPGDPIIYHCSICNKFHIATPLFIRRKK